MTTLDRALLPFALLAIAALVTACPPSPGPLPPPSPDASDASAVGDVVPPLDDCQKGCAALVKIHCALGDGGTDCVDSLRVDDESRKERTPSGQPLTCAAVAAITSKADAQRLGFVCPP